MTDAIFDWKPFCKDWLDAWTGNRPSALLDYYTTDALYIDPANPDGLRGQDELIPYFEKLLSYNPDWKWEIAELFNTEKGFTVKWKATIPVKETELTLYGMDIVEMRGTEICRNEVYFDRVKWMEMLR